MENDVVVWLEMGCSTHTHIHAIMIHIIDFFRSSQLWEWFWHAHNIVPVSFVCFFVCCCSLSLSLLLSAFPVNFQRTQQHTHEAASAVATIAALCFCRWFFMASPILHSIRDHAVYVHYGACNQHCKRKWTWMPLFFPSTVKHTLTHAQCLICRSNTQPFDQVSLPNQALSFMNIFSCDFRTIVSWFRFYFQTFFHFRRTLSLECVYVLRMFTS